MSYVAADVRNHVYKSRSFRHIWACVRSHYTVIIQTYDYGYWSWSLHSRKPNITLFRLNTTFTLKVDSKIELCKAFIAGQTARERQSAWRKDNCLNTTKVVISWKKPIRTQNITSLVLHKQSCLYHNQNHLLMTTEL